MEVRLFPLQSDEYSRKSFRQGSNREIGSYDVVASPEDTILRKLQWYRAGGERSERQWNDLQAVTKTVGTKMDIDYLRRWAGQLQVEDLLQRLLTQPG